MEMKGERRSSSEIERSYLTRRDDSDGRLDRCGFRRLEVVKMLAPGETTRERFKEVTYTPATKANSHGETILLLCPPSPSLRWH